MTLKGGNESIQGRSGGGRCSSALILVLESSLKTGLLNSLEEFLGKLLLLGCLGKTTDGSTGFVHVTGQFILDIEPLLLLNVSRKVSKTLLGFGDVSLLTGNS